LAFILVACIAACGAASSASPDDASPVAEPDAAPIAPEPDAGPLASEPDAGPLAPEPDAAPLGEPPPWPLTKTPGRSAARVAITPTRVVVLEETLTGLDQIEPGPRRIRAIDRRSFSERSWEPAPTARIADAVVHASGAISLAVVDDQSLITIVRLDDDLVPAVMTPLVDPEVATDPPADPTAAGLHANGATAESVRVAALGEEIIVSVFTSRNSVVAYRLRVADGAFATTWRSLIEPPAPLFPFLPIGGSYDTFGAIVAWFRASLGIDARGNAYLALWANPKRIMLHDLAFADVLAPLPTDPGGHDSDVIVTKIDADGKRLWSRVVGTRYEDEPYALAAAGDEVVVVGRSRRNPGFDNSQWDPWVAALDGSGTLRASRTVPFDALGILLAVGVDDAGAVVAGGSDGWTQNPDGLSVLTFGAKLVFTLADAAAAPTRVGLAPGPRHNEIRSIVVTDEGVWFAGHEDGPITHTGDGDAGQIHATGVVGFLPR
jgi:hypothetical protein